MPFYTIHEDVHYEVEAKSPAEAYKKFMSTADQGKYLTGVQDRYMTDEDGEYVETDDEQEEA